MVGIYKITNKINGKCYIGQSDNINARWQKHRKTSFNVNSRCYNYPPYKAIRKYGLDKFQFEVIEECSIEELDEKEQFYIHKYRAYEKGYNQTKGGIHARRYCCFDDETVDKVIKRLRMTGDSMPIIAEDFGVSVSTIRSINRGEYYRRKDESYPIRQGIKITNKRHSESATQTAIMRRKAERPAPLDLAKMVKEFGFEETGRKFDVSGKTISKWCQFYGIPYKAKELIAWYDAQMGINTPPKRIKTPITEIIKPVKQIDIKTGKIVAVFQSIGAATNAMGKSKSPGISRVCRGLQKTAYGYYWKFI